MHLEAMQWVTQYSSGQPITVLDIGGRFINGSPRGLYPFAEYTVLDVLDGPNVDIVADAAAWTPDREYDAVICCEVFEHAEEWPAICRTAYQACKPGGFLVITTAGPGRALHSGVDGGPRLHDGEWYGNVEPDELEQALKDAGWSDITVDHSRFDVRAHATR
jgi:SAM-dependent methyltransferase